MSNSNFKFRRFLIIFANVFVFIGAVFVIGMIGYYTAATLTGNNLQLTQYDADFQKLISSLINSGYFPLMGLIFYFGAMQLIYSALIIKWTLFLDDEQYIKHRFLVLVYSFFNLTFFTAFLLMSLDQSRMNTGIKVKRKMAFHESNVFMVSGILLFVLSLLLQFSKLNNPKVHSNFIITISVASILLFIGLLGVVSISKMKSENLTDNQSEVVVNNKSFGETFARFMIGFNIIFILVKMVILLVINTIGYISQIFGDNRQGFFSRINATINLVMMYTITFQVFKALTIKEDAPLVIDLTNVQNKTQTQRY